MAAVAVAAEVEGVRGCGREAVAALVAYVSAGRKCGCVCERALAVGAGAQGHGCANCPPLANLLQMTKASVWVISNCF